MSGPAHILVVDDDADLRETVALALRSGGHGVTEAADGRIALEALESAVTFRLIILDLIMPVMDGPTFLACKARGRHAAIPVVIFTSSASMGLEGFASVASVVAKLDGIDALLAAIHRAGGAAARPSLTGGFHV